LKKPAKTPHPRKLKGGVKGGGGSCRITSAIEIWSRTSKRHEKRAKVKGKNLGSSKLPE